jgi:hypothetical protein
MEQRPVYTNPSLWVENHPLWEGEEVRGLISEFYY